MRIHSLIFERSFCDNVRCKTVLKTSRTDVLALLNRHVEVSNVPYVEKGGVLVDSRG